MLRNKNPLEWQVYKNLFQVFGCWCLLECLCFFPFPKWGISPKWSDVFTYEWMVVGSVILPCNSDHFRAHCWHDYRIITWVLWTVHFGSELRRKYTPLQGRPLLIKYKRLSVKDTVFHFSAWIEYLNIIIYLITLNLMCVEK